MKYSRQRKLVLDTLRKLYHPSAEQVYHAIIKSGEKISIATVYRNLAALCQMGEIKKIEIAGQADFYDNVLCEHYHAVCQKCGAIVDIEPPKRSEYDLMLKKKYGFTALEHSVLIGGVCKKCAANTKKKTSAK